jgi:hypothetical protein
VNRYIKRAAPARDLRATGGIRQLFTVPENIRMAQYGHEIYGQFETLMESPGGPCRSCPTAGSLISSLATLNEVPYGKRRELPPVGIRRYGDHCGERLGSIVSVSSFSSDALYLNQGRC